MHSRLPILASVSLLSLAAAAFSTPGCGSSSSGGGPVSDAGPLSEGGEGGGTKIACTPVTLAEPTSGFFTDISAPSGITVNNFYPTPPAGTKINDHSRLAFADINKDGLDDIVAHSLFPNPQAGVPFEHLVFLNKGNKTFSDFSDESGLRAVQGAYFTFGDVDNDGDQDCFSGIDIQLTGETAALYLNDGAGHFTKKTSSGLEGIEFSANAVFADFNGDTFLDLYSGNGSTFNSVADQLFFGHGDGTFTDASQKLKERSVQPTNGVVTCDYDDDGDQDIFVSNYGVSIALGWNVLWENDGTGTFSNVAVARGFNALATGNYYDSNTGYGTTAQPGPATGYYGSNGFGIDCQDVDGDGHMDIWLATISHSDNSDPSRTWSDPSQLLINKGSAGAFAFDNKFLEKKLPYNEGDIDAAAVDFDNDGRIDLSVTRDNKYEGGYTAYDQKSWFGLMHQNADGTFTSMGKVSGINDDTVDAGSLTRMKAGQNLSWSDIDGDGDLDLLVGGRDHGGGRANFLFENTIGSQNGWLGVRLRGDGVTMNKDAMGARITLHMGDVTQVREVRSSRGTYSSADQRGALFGLADKGCVGTESQVSLDVRWPNGEVQTFPAGSFALNQYVVIDYATGLASTKVGR